jgi:hypothetical protein
MARVRRESFPILCAPCGMHAVSVKDLSARLGTLISKRPVSAHLGNLVLMLLA